MNNPFFFDPKTSLKLFGLKENFNFISTLYLKKKLPKVLMFTGSKGSGKSTLINHFLFSIFDSKNYDSKKNIYSEGTNFLNQFQNDTFSNIIYIKGADFKSVKIEDIRALKTKIFQSTILNKDRFIIFDDVELFNLNCLNALLKIIEEPTQKNYFFLVNNKSKPLLKTVESRSLELKIILNEIQRLEIINNLIDHLKLELILDIKSSKLTPGSFVKFNYLCKEYNISPADNYVKNLSILLNLYKKNKDILFINLAFFLTDYYFKHSKRTNSLKKDRIYDIQNHIFNNLNNFMQYNINQNTLITSVDEKLNHE